MDSLTKAKINLNAVLMNLVQLCKFDPVAAGMAKQQNITVSLKVKSGPGATLIFKDGKVEFVRGNEPKANIKLYFRDGEHLNKMFNGKANPIILKGITKAKFLTGNFTKLTDRLAYFLEPTDELLKDPQYFKINTYLTAYTAFFALAEIANNDETGKICAARVADGIILVTVRGGPDICLTVEKGRFKASIGSHSNPRAIMYFGSLKTANDILNGKSDIFTAIGEGDFAIKGFIPMLDNLSRLLDLVGPYLK